MAKLTFIKEILTVQDYSDKPTKRKKQQHIKKHQKDKHKNQNGPSLLMGKR